MHPYDDERVIAGQGTVALEMLREAPELDVLIVPVGGGGLLAGTLAAVKEIKPRHPCDRRANTDVSFAVQRPSRFGAGARRTNDRRGHRGKIDRRVAA